MRVEYVGRASLEGSDDNRLLATLREGSPAPSQSNVMVEHPELIAQRLGYWIGAFGRERVIAGTDCGFASFAGNDEIHESIVWAKFQALVEGAAIASKRVKAA